MGNQKPAVSKFFLWESSITGGRTEGGGGQSWLGSP